MTRMTSASRAWRLPGRDRGCPAASDERVRRRILLLSLRGTPNSILVAPVCTDESPSIRRRLYLRPSPLRCPERIRSGSRTHTRRYCTRRDSGGREETRKQCVDAPAAGNQEGPCCFIPGCCPSGQSHIPLAGNAAQLRTSVDPDSSALARGGDKSFPVGVDSTASQVALSPQFPNDDRFHHPREQLFERPGLGAADAHPIDGHWCVAAIRNPRGPVSPYRHGTGRSTRQDSAAQGRCW